MAMAWKIGKELQNSTTMQNTQQFSDNGFIQFTVKQALAFEYALLESLRREMC